MIILNLNELKPSFEEIDETKESSNYKQSLKNKKKTFKNKTLKQIKLF